MTPTPRPSPTLNLRSHNVQIYCQFAIKPGGTLCAGYNSSASYADVAAHKFIKRELSHNNVCPCEVSDKNIIDHSKPLKRNKVVKQDFFKQIKLHVHYIFQYE